jgi:hypothetical protein
MNKTVGYQLDALRQHEQMMRSILFLAWKKLLDFVFLYKLELLLENSKMGCSTVMRDMFLPGLKDIGGKD